MTEMRLFENSKIAFVYVLKESQLDKTSFSKILTLKGIKVLLGKSLLSLFAPLKCKCSQILLRKLFRPPRIPLGQREKGKTKLF